MTDFSFSTKQIRSQFLGFSMKNPPLGISFIASAFEERAESGNL